MTHDEAIKGGATERYVLDEMTDEERDAFEEHYFDCAVCAEDVKAAIAVRDEGLAALHQTPEPVRAPIPFPQPKRWFATPMAAAASALIAALSTFAGMKPMLNAARAPFVSAGEYRLESTRAAGEPVVVKNGDENFTLKVAIDTEDKAPDYTLRVFDAKGSEEFATSAPGEATRQGDVIVSVRGKTLEPGDYTLRVDGTEAGVASYRFKVR